MCTLSLERKRERYVLIVRCISPVLHTCRAERNDEQDIYLCLKLSGCKDLLIWASASAAIIKITVYRAKAVRQSWADFSVRVQHHTPLILLVFSNFIKWIFFHAVRFFLALVLSQHFYASPHPSIPVNEISHSLKWIFFFSSPHWTTFETRPVKHYNKMRFQVEIWPWYSNCDEGYCDVGPLSFISPPIHVFLSFFFYF